MCNNAPITVQIFQKFYAGARTASGVLDVLITSKRKQKEKRMVVKATKNLPVWTQSLIR